MSIVKLIELVHEREDGRIITYKYYNSDQAKEIFDAMTKDPHIVTCTYSEVIIIERKKLIHKYERQEAKGNWR